MFSLAFTLAALGIPVFGGIGVMLCVRSGRVLGRTLSQWIARTRRKTDEYSAERVRCVQKQLEILAHDVLKHRILGIASLVQELGESGNLAELPPDRLELYRTEFFRLCGIKANEEDRLWARWEKAFADIHKYTGNSVTVPPWLDPMFSDTVRGISQMRRILTRYMERESGTQKFLQSVVRARAGRCAGVYPTVLALADASRMCIVPEDTVHKAMAMVASQAGRTHSAAKIQVLGTVTQRCLCPAPSDLIVMSLARLLDNALELGTEVGIEAAIDTDAFTGISTLLFRVYDANETVPQPSDYGMGIRGIRQSSSAFGGGLQYRRDARGTFRKAAVLSFPVSEYAECTVSRVRLWVRIAYVLACLAALSAFAFCLVYAVGGPPVEFAGRGTNITEFSVRLGEELVIPLCHGGNRVRAEVSLLDESCRADSCTFPAVLDSLAPCATAIDAPECPGEIRWLPQFSDGLRQGRSYELSVHCISEGPPSSEDFQRIRVLVTRPNTQPRLLLLQVVNRTRNETATVENNHTVRAGVTDRLELHAVASDIDADPIMYRLVTPGGDVLSSADGTFPLEGEWSPFATATYQLEISDGIAPTLQQTIVLEADQLHPIELRNISLWEGDGSTRRSCEGTADSRICPIADAAGATMEVQAWFDPMQPRIHPVLELSAPDSLGYAVRPVQRHETSAPGDQWEIYGRDSRILGLVELTNAEAGSEPGLRTYTFRLSLTRDTVELPGLALSLSVSEHAGKMSPARTLVVFTAQSGSRAPAAFSTRHIELSEYGSEADAADASGSVWVYPQPGTQIEPTVTRITCEMPSLRAAFDTPTVRASQRAWEIGFQLRPGCIPGMRPDLPARSRMCAAEIHLGEEIPAETVWITVNARSCAPSIDEFTLASTREELARNEFRWHFRVIDTDGDLQPSGIRITGTQDYRMDVSSVGGAAGNVYEGTIAVSATCDNPLFQANSRVLLHIEDGDGHESVKMLQAQLNCPPLVSTADGKTHFTVRDGAQIAISLRHDPDVKLALVGRIGTILNGTFYWNASCSYGRGPHTVEIRTESPSRYGRPLMLDLEITRCLPRYAVLFDGTDIPSDAPLRIGTGSHALAFVPSGESAGFRVEPDPATEVHGIRISATPSKTGFEYALECTDPGAGGELRFRIVPEADDSDEFDPVVVRVQCE